MGHWPSSNDVNATKNAAQLCDPAIAIPTIRSSAGVVKHGKSHMDAAEEIEPAWSTSSSNSMLSGNFTNFFKYLQTDRPPAEGEENLLHCASRSFCLLDVVHFLEESNAHIVSKASQELADMNASYKSEVAILKRDHEQRVLELSSSLKKISKDFFDASAEVTRAKGSLTAVESELQDSRKAAEKMQGLLEKTRNNSVIKGLEAEIHELSRALEKASEDLSGVRVEVSSTRIRFMKLQDRDKAAQMMHVQNSALIDELETRLKDLNAKKEGLEGELRRIQDAAQAKDREVPRLNDVIQEMERTIAKMLQVSLSKTLKREVALFVQNLRQNSLKSESTANDHDNLALLESARHNVDRATDRLAKYLNKYAPASELEFPIRFILCRDFSKPDEMKHIWGHWICEQMFQGFEHAFFDASQEQTSPLDFQKHRVECFQIFQEKKRVPSLLYFKECDLFRRFCARMFSLVFPPHLIEDHLHFRQVLYSPLGDGGEESKLYLNFLDLAKAIYLLHKLSFSFDPPARILRIGYGEPYDKRYHDSVVTDADNDIMPTAEVLMLRPGFQVKSTVIKCRVLILEEDFRLQ